MRSGIPFTYLNQYDILCQRLVQEQLYIAALMASLRTEAKAGEFVQISEMTNLQTFVAALVMLRPKKRDSSNNLKRRGKAMPSPNLNNDKNFDSKR